MQSCLKNLVLSTCLVSGLQGTRDCSNTTTLGEKADCTVSACSLTEPSQTEQLAIFYPGSIFLIKNSFTMKKID